MIGTFNFQQQVSIPMFQLCTKYNQMMPDISNDVGILYVLN